MPDASRRSPKVVMVPLGGLSPQSVASCISRASDASQRTPLSNKLRQLQKMGRQQDALKRTCQGPAERFDALRRSVRGLDASQRTPAAGGAWSAAAASIAKTRIAASSCAIPMPASAACAAELASAADLARAALSAADAVAAALPKVRKTPSPTPIAECSVQAAASQQGPLPDEPPLPTCGPLLDNPAAAGKPMASPLLSGQAFPKAPVQAPSQQIEIEEDELPLPTSGPLLDNPASCRLVSENDDANSAPLPTHGPLLEEPMPPRRAMATNAPAAPCTISPLGARAVVPVHNEGPLLDEAEWAPLPTHGPLLGNPPVATGSSALKVTVDDPQTCSMGHQPCTLCTAVWPCASCARQVATGRPFLQSCQTEGPLLSNQAVPASSRVVQQALPGIMIPAPKAAACPTDSLTCWLAGSATLPTGDDLVAKLRAAMPETYDD